MRAHEETNRDLRTATNQVAHNLETLMARSAHVTKKQLIRERWFTHSDAVPQTDDMTELERQDIQKRVYKTNEAFRRQAIRDDAPAQAKIVLRKSSVKRVVNKRRTNQ